MSKKNIVIKLIKSIKSIDSEKTNKNLSIFLFWNKIKFESPTTNIDIEIKSDTVFNSNIFPSL
jgi:hypothetical protein